MVALALVSVPAHAQLILSPPRESEGETQTLRERYEADPDNERAALDYVRALAGQDDLQARRRASLVLRRALRVHPESIELRLSLGDLYYRQGYLTLARQQYERALESEADTGPAYARLGRLALRDWLKYQRSSSQILARSIWESAVERDGGNFEAWLGLALLALVDRNPDDAAVYAGRAVLLAESGLDDEVTTGLFTGSTAGATPERAYARPDPRGEALLMLGAASYYQGDLARADSAFQRALPRLSPAARAHVEDIMRLLPIEMGERIETEKWSSGKHAEFVRRYWAALDPDLGTAANEARIEYIARGALAYFLYFDQRRQRWDERGHILARYGLPDGSRYNPVTLGSRPLTANTLVWTYDALGMVVYLEDRTLNEDYDLPISLHYYTDPIPLDAAVDRLASAGEISLADRGVFRSRPPNTERLAGAAGSAFFRRVRGFDPRAGAATGEARGRVEVYVSLEENLGPEFHAEAVVFDSAWREVARTATPGAAWCGVEGTPITQFNFELPPGEYRVGVSARDPGNRRQASWKFPVSVPAVLPGQLEISDIEVSCEFFPDTLGGPFDKTQFAVYPSPRRIVPSDRPLGVYFEIYGLLTGQDGRSRHTAQYVVRWKGPDDRSLLEKIFRKRERIPKVEILRSEETPGRSRFQFVTAELEDPVPGPYELEIKIKDEISGQEVSRKVDFTIAPAS